MVMILRYKPAIFAAVTCRLIDLAGRPTGRLADLGGGGEPLWGGGEPRQWQAPVRMLCRIICQLSEVRADNAGLRCTFETYRIDLGGLPVGPHLLGAERQDRRGAPLVY
jgi:hypothetical protein